MILKIQTANLKNNKIVYDLVEEAAILYAQDFPRQHLDPIFTETIYWGLERNEQERMSYRDFYLSVKLRIDEILQTDVLWH